MQNSPIIQDAKTSKPLISIVVPLYNEEEVFSLLVSELEKLFNRLEDRYKFEVVMVNDGSKDATWSLVNQQVNIDSRFVGFSLSRNFGHQAALSAGYDVAKGDAVVSIDADLQDPLEVIISMLDEWSRGVEIVFAVRASRAGETFFKVFTAKTFYRILKLLGANYVPLDSGDFRLMDRKALEALKEMRETHRFVRGMVGWLGFRTSQISYHRQERQAGETKYPFSKMLKLSIDAAISSSMMPLRFAYFSAFAVGITVIGYLALVVIRFMFFGEELVPGWTSLILAVVGLGCANLIAIGIMGEYVGRIYEESKARPLYIVSNTARLDNQDKIDHNSAA